MYRTVFETFFSPGEVAEIRAVGGISGKNPAWSGSAFGQKPTVAGYFDNPDDFEKAAKVLDKVGPHGIYFTVQPVLPAFLARSVNKLQANLNPVTSDDNVGCYRWLLVDLDPQINAGFNRWTKRPGISSTEEELAAGAEMAKKVTAWLEEELGLARAIRACSGNGYHLNYRLPDLPNDKENRELIRKCLEAIGEKFKDLPEVDIDQTVHNPARIWKLYGTTARKGEATKDRPHRASYLFKDQPTKLADVPVCDMEAIYRLRDLVANKQPTGTPSPSSQKSRSTKKRGVSSQLGPLDVGKYLDHYGRQYKIKSRGSVTMYSLQHCVFDANHGPNEASICQSSTPPFLTYQCFHDSCHGRTWKDAKAIISGDDSLAQFCEGYDPNWTPYDDPGTGVLRDMEVSTPQEPGPAAGSDVPAEVPPIPLPDQIDPEEFYVKRGKRLVFVPQLMAKYYLALLNPIVCTGGVFWKYEKGVWKRFSEDTLGEICVKALKERIQASWIDGTKKIFTKMVNRLEENWPEQGQYINCLSGMIDIETWEVLPHDPKYGSRTQIPCHFSQEAYDKMDRWFTFMDEVFPGSQAKQDIFQEYFGYSFLADCRFQKALFLIGGGANGKSVALTVVAEVLGPQNISTLSFMELGQRFKVQFLQGKLSNISTETEAKDPAGTDVFKAMVTGDRITGEAKYGDPYHFIPYAKEWVAMNDPPKIVDKSFGLGRRIIVLHFNRRFKEEEMDRDLVNKLMAEKDGIFYWAMMGLARLLERGSFEIPKEIEEDKFDLVATMNPLLLFVDERCEFGEGDHIKIKPKELYHDYQAWCKEGHNKPLSRNNFYHQIRNTFTQVEDRQVGKARIRHFCGITLRWPTGVEPNDKE